ncbi:MAG TPA: DMT family transporter [Vicinamibacterales bacterium]|nr:DMT family transporter [Vicinamibacterales bacterium]
MNTATAAASVSGTPASSRAFVSPAALDWAVLALPGLIWGTSFLLIAEGLAAVPPDGITFLRFVIGFLTLSLVPAARQPVRTGDRAGIAWLGVIWLALPMSMFPHAEQHVSSALTGMLNGAVPLIAGAVATVISRQAPGRAVVVALTVGFGGAVLMAAPGLSSGGNSSLGVVLILVALVSYGVAINLARPLQQRNGALPVVWRALGVAMVLTAPLGVRALTQAEWHLRPMLAILALGVLGTAAANVLMALAAGRLGATRASGTTFLIPVVALVLGVIVRGETVPVLAIGGSALCLAGAWLMRRAK